MQNSSTTGARLEASVSSARDLAPAAAEALLERKGLVRRASAFVLQSESDVASKLKALRSRADEFNAASEKFYAFQLPLKRIAELDEEIPATRAQIADLDFLMKQFPAGRWIHGMNMDDDAVFRQLRAERDLVVRRLEAEMIPERDILRSRQPSRAALKQASEAVDRQREAALGALADLREAVVVTRRGYDELTKDAQVKRALAKLGPARLGPSEELMANAEVLTRFERWVGLSKTTEVPKPASVGPVQPKGDGRTRPHADGGNTAFEAALNLEKSGNITGAAGLYKFVIKKYPDTAAARRANDRMCKLPSK